MKSTKPPWGRPLTFEFFVLHAAGIAMGVQATAAALGGAAPDGTVPALWERAFDGAAALIWFAAVAISIVAHFQEPKP